MSSSEIAVMKRLHVSGLTPQISADDLRRRLSSFGSVKALDGLGKLDALGQYRPFAYATLETTKTQFAKCMYSLCLALFSFLFRCFVVSLMIVRRSQSFERDNMERRQVANWRSKA